MDPMPRASSAEIRRTAAADDDNIRRKNDQLGGSLHNLPRQMSEFSPGRDRDDDELRYWHSRKIKPPMSLRLDDNEPSPPYSRRGRSRSFSTATEEVMAVDPMQFDINRMYPPPPRQEEDTSPVESDVKDDDHSHLSTYPPTPPQIHRGRSATTRNKTTEMASDPKSFDVNQKKYPPHPPPREDKHIPHEVTDDENLHQRSYPPSPVNSDSSGESDSRIGMGGRIQRGSVPGMFDRTRPQLVNQASTGVPQLQQMHNMQGHSQPQQQQDQRQFLVPTFHPKSSNINIASNTASRDMEHQHHDEHEDQDDGNWSIDASGRSAGPITPLLQNRRRSLDAYSLMSEPPAPRRSMTLQYEHPFNQSEGNMGFKRRESQYDEYSFIQGDDPLGLLRREQEPDDDGSRGNDDNISGDSMAVMLHIDHPIDQSDYSIGLSGDSMAAMLHVDHPSDQSDYQYSIELSSGQEGSSGNSEAARLHVDDHPFNRGESNPRLMTRQEDSSSGDRSSTPSTGAITPSTGTSVMNNHPFNKGESNPGLMKRQEDSSGDKSSAVTPGTGTKVIFEKGSMNNSSGTSSQPSPARKLRNKKKRPGRKDTNGLDISDLTMSNLTDLGNSTLTADIGSSQMSTDHWTNYITPGTITPGTGGDGNAEHSRHSTSSSISSSARTKKHVNKKSDTTSRASSIASSSSAEPLSQNKTKISSSLNNSFVSGTSSVSTDSRTSSRHSHSHKKHEKKSKSTSESKTMDSSAHTVKSEKKKKKKSKSRSDSTVSSNAGASSVVSKKSITVSAAASSTTGISPDDYMISKKKMGDSSIVSGGSSTIIPDPVTPRKSNMTKNPSEKKSRKGSSKQPKSGAAIQSSSGASSGDNNTTAQSKEQHRPRLKAILRRKRQQEQEGADCDRASGTTTSQGNRSSVGKLRRYLKSYCGLKKENNKHEKKSKDGMVKKNPYALDKNKEQKVDDVETPRISSIEQHDITSVMTPRAINAHAEEYEVHSFAPPALVMSPGNSSSSSSTSPRMDGYSNSMNSSSHHCHSLLSIQEGDILREKDFLTSHSSHSDGHRDAMKHSSHSDTEMFVRGKNRDYKDAPLNKFSTHSEGTGVTSMMTDITNSRHSYNNSETGISLTLEDRFKLLSLPLPVHQELASPSSRSGFREVSSDVGSNVTSYSVLDPKSLLTLSASRRRSRALAATGGDDTTHIINLPWSDEPKDNFGIDQSKRIRGKYTGPVDTDSLQPHGEGMLVVPNGSERFLTFFGKWDKGKLISHLSSDPPAGMVVEEDHDILIRSTSLEGRRGSNLDPSPHNSPTDMKQTRRRLGPCYTNSGTSTSHTMNTTEKNLDIRFVINKSSKQKHMAGKHRIPNQIRYMIGEACRTPIDMIIHRNSKKAVQSTSLLSKWDQAFVKRSNGVWTVAVLIDRALQPRNTQSKQRRSRREQHHPSSRWCTVWEIDPRVMELEESMLFAIDGDGATKIVSKKSWGKYVRRIKPA